MTNHERRSWRKTTMTMVQPRHRSSSQPLVRFLALVLLGLHRLPLHTSARVTLVEQFSAMRTDTCGGGFPTCPADPSDPGGAIFTIFTALDVPNQKSRVGPWSRLPADKNQIQVEDMKKCMQYNMWADTTTAPPTVINCTRLALLPEACSLKAMRESWQGWFPTKPQLLPEKVKCGWPNVDSECDTWQWNHTFPVGCPNGTVLTGSEPERWVLGVAGPPNFTAGVAPLIAMTNDIHQPGCGGSGPFSASHHQWYHSDWGDQYTSPPAPSMFDVPADDKCPEVPVYTATVSMPGLRPSYRA